MQHPPTPPTSQQRRWRQGLLALLLGIGIVLCLLLTARVLMALQADPPAPRAQTPSVVRLGTYCTTATQPFAFLALPRRRT